MLEDNIKIDLTYLGCEVVEFIEAALGSLVDR
jgi:hypothetical protein